MEYDPTNGLISGQNLIRIAVTRDPSQAIPIGGTFDGSTGQFLGMTVDVTVHASMTPHVSQTAPEPVMAPPMQAPTPDIQPGSNNVNATDAEAQPQQYNAPVMAAQNAQRGNDPAA